MKQGTKFMLPVGFDMELSLIERCEFIFTQRGVSKTFTYPSDKAELLEDGIGLIWEPEDTYLFDTTNPISMDTWIKVVGSDMNPQTNIVTLTMLPTHFKRV